jgi:hypothetical protein
VALHPQWKRAEEEQCAFHSIAMLRRTPVSMMAHDSLPSTASRSSTIGIISSTLFSGVSYLTGKVPAPLPMLCLLSAELHAVSIRLQFKEKEHLYSLYTACLLVIQRALVGMIFCSFYCFLTELNSRNRAKPQDKFCSFFLFANII